MALEVIYDNNKFLADGKTPNPAYGTTTEKVHPDPPAAAPKSLTKAEFQALLAANAGDATAALAAWP